MQSRRLAREAIIGLIYELSFHDATEKPEDILADARAARGIPEDEAQVLQMISFMAPVLANITEEAQREEIGSAVESAVRSSMLG